MGNKNNKVLIIVLCFILQLNAVMSLWEFAVTTKNKIIFYDDNWSTITSAAHQFDELSAIAFDESEEEVYFNDQLHNNGSIFSIKLSQIDENHSTERILSRTQNETIVGMTFDPVDRILYWTDTKNRKIYKLSADDENAKPEILFDFINEDTIPDGIAIDICRRKLYWTNSNHKKPSIERSSLNGNKRETIVDTNLFLPHGIVVDQDTNRLYWVVDQEGSHYSVESSNFDGTDRQLIVSGLNNVPLSLAVTKKSIYWTDIVHSSVWSISKANKENNEVPVKVQNYTSPPKGIVTRIGLLSRLGNNVNCKEQIKLIKDRLLAPKHKDNLTVDKEAQKHKLLFCMNNGEYNERSGTCICKVGYTGNRCEISDCHNYCVHGTCEISAMGFPHCTCQEGFFGERCQSYKCTNYCLNGGHCSIRDGNIPTCTCPETHSGVRCESNTTETCLMYCRYGINDPDWSVPLDCPDTCDEQSQIKSTYTKSSTNIGMCSSALNKTVIIIVVGVITALTLVFAIIKAIRHIYKPARPRIKKTFVVQKKISQTPLTSRPLATEQCEITIENCCNMNICDTPCFDPKLLQQSCDSSKDDKKVLINHMEEDLY